MGVCLARSVGLTWRRPGWVGKMSFSVRRKRFVSRCYSSIGLKRNYMETSRHSTQLFIEGLLTSSAGDSPASPSASPESERERMMIATSGRRCVELLMRFDRVGWWGKMFSAFLIGGGGWCSNRCKLTWSLRGTRYGRTFCRLRVLARRTSEIGSFLLPTPTVMDSEEIRQFRKDTIEGFRRGLKPSMTLTHYMVAGFLPTPTASDSKGSYRENSSAFLKRLEHSRGVSLSEELQRLTGGHFRLNPRFVLEMMGFPPDWTALPFQTGSGCPFGEQVTR